MTLTAPGQTYAFARPVIDLYGNALTKTFQVIAASGATPAANATFTATDGDLFVGGAGTNITVAALALAASSNVGDVKLQGTTVNPLVLNNATQNIGTSATRDVQVRGNVSLTGGTQNFTANRTITVQAEQGSVAISGADQKFISSHSAGGALIPLRAARQPTKPWP